MLNNLKLSLTATLSLALSASAFALKPFNIPGEQPFRRRWRRGSAPYPEQSPRQAMRRFRRAQGGPGIYLNAQRGIYLPVGCPSLEAFEDNNWPGARA